MNMKSKTFRKTAYSLLPFASGILLLCCYFFVPNYKKNEITLVYPGCIALAMLAMLAVLLLSKCSEKLRAHYFKNVPWFTAIFLLLMLFDCLTLKSGVLGLPMFPWPDMLLNEMIEDRATLLDCAKNSLKLLFTGYFYGLLLALVTGVAAGRFEKARYWIAPVLRFVGPIPSVTWMPLFFILSPTLFTGCVVMVAYSVWHPVASGLMNGIMQVRRSYIEAGKMLGVRSEKSMILHITVPLVMPNLFQGLIGGMRAACGSLVIAEMMGVESGLAWYMTWQRGWGNFTKMYTAIVCICITFFAVDVLLSAIKKRVLRWQEAEK